MKINNRNRTEQIAEFALKRKKIMSEFKDGVTVGVQVVVFVKNTFRGVFCKHFSRDYLFKRLFPMSLK
jgi:hypothetical protein